MQGRRVVVTGLGIVSPLGCTVDSAWEALTSGTSGIATIERFDPGRVACKIAGEVSGFSDSPRLEKRDLRRIDLFIRYAIAAAEQSLADAGLSAGEGFDPDRAGSLIGSGIGGLPLIEDGHRALLESGPRRVSPFFIPSAIINMAAGWVSMLNDLRGPNLALATACTTGSHAIGEGARKIAYGEAEVMVAGGSEGTVTELAIAGFSSARALSTRNDEPERASRPFDSGRDGFVLGEGAGILVLEELEHAQARGARIYCELAGYGTSGDAHHITAPPEDGGGAFRAMRAALADAGAAPGDVDHINAHGTSTPLGDKAETSAIRRLFEGHADSIAVSATKSMTGHLLGAAGGIEGVFSCLAIERQTAPPTINLDDPDPACDLDYVGGSQGRQTEIGAALSNSFGFGGTNASLLFSRL